LIGKGVPLRIYDPDVAIHDVFGRNRAYVDEHLPHVAQLVSTDFNDVLSTADVVIVAKRLPDVSSVSTSVASSLTVIDLVGIPELGDAIRPWSTHPAKLPAHAAAAASKAR
jgi:GDP-mannose 6-dehydrogenase